MDLRVRRIARVARRLAMPADALVGILNSDHVPSLWLGHVLVCGGSHSLSGCESLVRWISVSVACRRCRERHLRLAWYLPPERGGCRGG